MKRRFRYLLYGVGTGMLGLGLQNFNPLEPRDCTHECSVVLGLSVFVIVWYIVPMSEFIIYGIKEYRKKRATLPNSRKITDKKPMTR